MTARIFAALCAVCLTVLLNWQSRYDATANESYQHRESSVLTPQHRHHQEATLTDASQIYRICSSRPQRILPTQAQRRKELPRRLAVLPSGSITSNPFIPIMTADAVWKQRHSASQPRATITSLR